MRTNEYLYEVGDEVNGLKIISQTRRIINKNNSKGYEVQSLTFPDAPTYITDEYNLKRGSGDAYVKGQKVFEGNSLYSMIEYRKYLVNIEEAKRIRPNHKKPKIFKCPDCGKEKKISPNKLVTRGLFCINCSSNISYPELVLKSYLESKNINYEYQYVFDDFKNYKFDFKITISGIVYLIETHGEQHYNSENIWYERSFLSDKAKRIYCIKKSGTYLIELDCRESDFSYIINNINKCTYLPNVSVNDEKEILKIMKTNKRYPVKKIIELYNNGETTYQIGEKFKVSGNTIANILKRNNIKLRTNVYSNLPMKEIEELYIKGITPKNIGELYGTNATTIRSALKRNGIKLRSSSESKKGFPAKNKKKILCLNTGDIFESITEASKFAYSASPGNISKVLNLENRSAGKHPETKEKLYWKEI